MKIMIQNYKKVFRGRGREFFNIDLRADYRIYAMDKEQREEMRLQQRLEERRQEQERMKKHLEDEEDKKEQERMKEQQYEEEQSLSLFEIHANIAKKEERTGHSMTKSVSIGRVLKKK